METMERVYFGDSLDKLRSSAGLGECSAGGGGRDGGAGRWILYIYMHRYPFMNVQAKTTFIYPIPNLFL